ncbi:Uma2 family endonuclease [Streptomyces endophytica]|uniref:Uma2 family endonuclease n=1 Tax=Streptomyces endophytica TaxID=2991496 RepID=A0ABY6P7T9_9ACTN|nr:Uma2 family endonuclease [Streptomyces endophytica]UZJ29880.1 Uma2 family endonuclease [Streptomyces endophytica]
MSALTVDHAAGNGPEWDDLVRIWEQADAREGWKVEIIEGIVTVSPPPDNNHNFIAEKVQRRLYSVLPEDWGIYQTLGTGIPLRKGLYIPDLAVVPVDVVLEETGEYVSASTAKLIVEVTSKSNASNDRIAKAAGYARAGVPLYLLVDRFAPAGPTITLFGEPTGDVYRVLHTVKFGDELALPAPFGLTLDTAIFPAV